MTWILLIILVGYFAIQFPLSYAVLKNTEYPSEAALTMLQFPDAFRLIFATAQGFPSGIGGLLLVILVAFMMGNEYHWGTLRQTMAYAGDRQQYLGAKVLSLLILAVIITFTSLLVGIAFACATTSWLGDLNADFLTFSLVGDVGIMFGGTVLGLTVISLLVLLFTILGRSSWVGLGVYLGYAIIVEGAITAIASAAGEGWIKSIPDYLIGLNSMAFLQMEELGEDIGWQFEMSPGIPHAVLVLILWCAILGGISFWLFKKRDITAVS
jgi:ABC-type transport system involved in multi-copper enzyme maturation permease subunit